MSDCNWEIRALADAIAAYYRAKEQYEVAYREAAEAKDRSDALYKLMTDRRAETWKANSKLRKACGEKEEDQ